MEKAPGFLKKHKKLSLSIGAILLLMTGAGAVYAFEQYQYTQTKEAKEEQQLQEAKKEIDTAVTVVGDQIPLPKNEEPVLATVSERDKLLNQKFFEKSQNGDQLLMYPKNKKIYLYRPSTKKLIAVSALAYGDPTPTPIGGIVAGASSSAAASSTAEKSSTAEVLYPRER